jgi:hypothetical protein
VNDRKGKLMVEGNAVRVRSRDAPSIVPEGWRTSKNKKPMRPVRGEIVRLYEAEFGEECVELIEFGTECRRNARASDCTLLGSTPVRQAPAKKRRKKHK